MTTATDIYSLGAVLYKLLTGASPRGLEGDSTGAIAGSVSSARVMPPSKLAQDLKGDIELILLKALRPEPQERYASVEQLSEDLENFIQSRPIRARTGDVWYQTRKFFRRYWLPVAAATLTVGSLFAGLTVANHERKIAERRFTDVRQLANKLFDIDEQVSRLQGGTEARRFILETSLEYLRRITADVRMDPELALEVGAAYLRVAGVQRVDTLLGQTQLADVTAQKAQTLVDSVLASQPFNRIALLRSAEIAQERMLMASDRYPEVALQFGQKSAERLEAYISVSNQQHHVDRLEAENAILVYLNVANVYAGNGQFDESVRISRQTIELARTTKWPAYAGAALLNLSMVYRGRGQLDEALQTIRESAQILEPPRGAKSVGRLQAFVSALIWEGRILGEDAGISLRRAEEALPYLQRAAKIADDLARRDPNQFTSRERVFTADTVMSNILRHTDPRRALEMCDHGLNRLAEIKDHPVARLHEVEVLAASTYPLRRLGRNVEARRRLDAAFERLQQLNSYPAEIVKPGSEVDAALSALADYEADNGNIPRALEIYEELLRKGLASDAKPRTNLAAAVEVSRVYAAISELCRRTHQTESQFAMEARRLELWRYWDTQQPNNRFIHRQLEPANTPPVKLEGLDGAAVPLSGFQTPGHG
jgi:tetratricopeptide (TPR) repeat protein